MLKQIFVGLLLLLSFGLFGQESKPIKVGEEILKSFESPHPYKGTRNTEGDLVWSQNIYFKDAAYISVHFKKIQLAESDYIVVKAPDESRSWNYNNQEFSNGFWSIPINGDLAIIEIHSVNKRGSYGYYIDKIARGYTHDEFSKLYDFEAICGQDDSENAACYKTSHPIMYNRSKSVARLLINGTSACTGWLVGSEGQILTCNHCVEDAGDAQNVTVEFMAEGTNCSTNCQSWFACPGNIEATTTTLVQTDVNLDYSLLQLPVNVSSTYGYLQLRSSGAVLNEQIYIPQHPAAWGKRIAYYSDYANDAQGLAHVQTITAPRCGGTGVDVGYFADTQGGSSGSPVIATNDNLVVALHHCGTCPNRGVPIQEIINDLGSNLPDDALGYCPANLTITANISGGSAEFLASNSITAKNKIYNAANVHYGANNSVKLQTGFRVYSGCSFRANLIGCGGSKSGSSEAITRTDNGSDLINLNQDIIEKDNHPDFTVYPNPNNGFFTIALENYEGSIQVMIFDLAGSIKYSTNLTDNINNLDLSALSKGVYILEIKADSYTDRTKIVIE
ncbi:MAG: trypsin-like peptidase domain-containing protein [Bacteroidales bacterium]|nr:trypsin-like peptidase domain-containing protein [Bacteroidales bacterium]